MSPRRTTEQADATRRQLLRQARRLFARRGYGGVSAEEIVRAARVTRGALYHHFSDKRDLFRAVFEEVEQETLHEVAAAALAEADPWRRQLTALERFLDACQKRDVQQIVLRDAPSVLGWEEWRRLEERYGLGLVRAGLESLAEEGVIERQPIEPLAHVVFGSLMEAGLVIAAAEDPERARREVGDSVRRLIEGLRRPATRSGARASARAGRRGRG